MATDVKGPVCGDCPLCVPVRISWGTRAVDDGAEIADYTLRPACIRDPYRPLLVRRDEVACGYLAELRGDR